MKKIILITIVFIAIKTNAQTTIADSIQSGPNYGNEVYYSFATGKVKEAPAKEWQLAFSIGNFNVAVRTNSAATIGGVTLYEKPGKDTTAWAATNFDTTGIKTWKQALNSDEDWEIGAFNSSASGQTDYGWGEYLQNQGHIVKGHRLYVVSFNPGTGIQYKKIWVYSKAAGVWKVRFANLDGTDAQELTILSSAYPTKNFVYVNLATGAVIDREPARTTWDFILTRFHGKFPNGQGGFVMYPQYGILTNAGIKTAEVRRGNQAGVTLADTGVFSFNISTIGADWKNSMFTGVIDTLSYFVKVRNGDIYKLKFSGIESGSITSGKNGKVKFNTTKVYSKPNVSVKSINNINSFSVYPNPTQSGNKFTLLYDINGNFKQIAVYLTDINGRKIFKENNLNKGFNAIEISENLQAGIYFISLHCDNKTVTQKIIIQ